jgi:hypothetical protein
MNEAELRKVEKEKMQLDSKPKFIDFETDARVEIR